MPGNDLARQIKERLTTRQVVELYGFHPDRGGYIQCPFHTGDNHGSLKVYDGSKTGWHCFGCGAGGSVIDFVMRLFGLSFAQACLKLNCDFGLGLTGERPSMAERSALLEARRREAQEKEAAAALYREKAAEYRQLWEAQKFLSPDIVGYIHPLYAEAVKKLPVLECWLDQNIHQFRHLNASLLIYNGEDVRAVSAALGHSQTSTTLNIYAHTFETAQARACDALADALPVKFGKKQA